MAHSDATGFLAELAAEINHGWFNLIEDLTVSGIKELDADNLELLTTIFVGNASYLRPTIRVTSSAAAGASSVPDFLEAISGFSNFKLIGDSLQLDFKKPIGLIFGSNGSGKSSICETFRILASPETPSRPIPNVRTGNKSASQFKFKFKSDTALQSWTGATGYGIRRNMVKYFDSAVAVKNIKSAVDPGRVIELAPFKLHVFERAMTFTTKLRQSVQDLHRTKTAELANALLNVRTTFATFSGMPLSIIDERSINGLDVAIQIGESFSDLASLNEKKEAVIALEKASSEEGLKLLKAEERELSTFLEILDQLIFNVKEFQRLNPAKISKEIAVKQSTQEILSKSIIPSGSTLDEFKSLAKAAESLCKLEDATDEPCPLCRRHLGQDEVNLFKKYHDLLVGDLEKQIAALKLDFTKSEVVLQKIAILTIEDWDKYATLPIEFVEQAKAAAKSLIEKSNMTEEPVAETIAVLNTFNSEIEARRTQLGIKKKAVETATTGRAAVLKKLEESRKEIQPLIYAHSIHENMSVLKVAKRAYKRVHILQTGMTVFTSLLTKITTASKKAHEELVVVDFESRLNDEYLQLTEKDMTAFGVKLARKGADASVTVIPQVGGKELEGVLSEGELRMHSLALFFAELETCSQSVVVFDDPVSSFDYNYIANYCIRLREFAKKHPTKQIVVLTHNWEFFVQLQTTLKSGGLDNHLSVQVLENCSSVSEYVEKADELKAKIDAILSAPGEPSNSLKESLAGNMRRLIESIINTHVFANQRQQYKQRKQPVSEFVHYIKLVPLLPDEATDLRDLYAKLSVTEHDDARAAYVNTDKATFQSRYDTVKAIEVAIIGRK